MLTILLLCLCLSSTFAISPSSSMFMGRSADIVVESAIQQDSVIFFKGEQFSTTELNKLGDTQFADLFAHVMGTQPFHVDADRTGFPTSSLFYKPKAALLVAFDSVGAEILNKYPTLSLLQGAHASAITTPSSTTNTQTLLANIATGVTPSQHGIVGSQWRRPVTGTLVNAYDSNGLSFAASVADILLQETQGRSLVVSASASSSFASALAAHPELVSENLGWRAHAYSFQDGGFVSRYEEPSTEQLLEIPSDLLSSLLVDITVSKVTFSKNTPEDLALLAELAFVKTLISKLSVMSSMVKDEVPDMYSFVFSSLKGIQTRYGVDSEEFAAALALVDKATESLTVALNAAYENRVATAYIALNARDVSTEALKQRVYNKVSPLLYSEKDFSAFYPAVYVRTNEFFGSNRDIVCANLQRAVSDSNANVVCGAPLVQSSRATRSSWYAASNDSNICPSENTTDPQADEDSATVWSFWLNFFITLIIASFVGWGVYCLAFVGSDASKDSLLFRATGRGHHHQN